MEKQMYLMAQYNLCQRRECAAHCLTMRIELPFERNTAYHSGFSSVRNINFVQNISIQVKGRSTESLGKRPCKLEAGGSSTLFPSEN
jgi:hypothetical protein